MTNAVRGVFLDPIFKARVFARRHLERSEHPVPNGENAAKVAIEVLRICRMMDLVMRGAQDDVSQNPAKGNPELRMLKMPDRPKEEDEKDVLPVDRERFSGPPKDPRQYA